MQRKAFVAVAAVAALTVPIALPEAAALGPGCKPAVSVILKGTLTVALGWAP